jgi:hypothetical protein
MIKWWRKTWSIKKNFELIEENTKRDYYNPNLLTCANHGFLRMLQTAVLGLLLLVSSISGNTVFPWDFEPDGNVATGI